MVESTAASAEFKASDIVDKLSNTLFQKNRARFIQLFKEELGDKSQKALALFKGSGEVPLYSSDVAYPEYQEAFFYYLFGAFEMDCYGVIDFDKEEATLFVPNMDNYYKIWMTVMKAEDFQEKYQINVQYVENLQQFVNERQPSTIYLNQGVNSDSGLTTMIPEEKYYRGFPVDKEVMHDILSESRVVKNDEEIVAMRMASKITSEAHVYVMRNTKPGQREVQLESFFNFFGQQNYFTGRVAPYLSICGCGPTAATLHYHDNDKTLKDGMMMLTDQGHSLHHYCSDVTISFPVNGKFTQKQKEIYNIVLNASRAVIDKLKPGVNWVDMHLLAEKITLQGLIDLGCLNGDVDEMLGGRLGFIFQPHGLGHLIGLDTHDVGGYLKNNPERIQKPGLKNLRTARLLKENMCLTVEPGLYFRDFLIEGHLDSLGIELKYLNLEKIREYQKEVGGVRIEDVLVITADGCENLSNGVPRTAEDIETCMRGEQW